jgi:hypothetical protein
MARRLNEFVTGMAVLATLSAGLMLTHAAPASAAVIDSVPDQAGCEVGGSAGPLWGAGTGGRTRPVVAAMTVGGEVVADPVNIPDHKLGVAICTPFSNARIVGLNVVHREGSNFMSDLTGAQTPSGAPVTANTPITITMTNLGTQAEYFTDAIIHGDVTSYTTTNLGQSNASLTFTVEPARTPIVDSTIPGSEFCTATPPVCNAAKSEMDILAVNAAMDMDEAGQFQDMSGAYFSLSGAVGGYVTAATAPGGGKYLKATLGGPHTLADGTTLNVGSMQAYLPNDVLTSLLGIDTAGLSEDDFAVTRNEGSTATDAPFSVTPVSNGALLTVTGITFSSPVYEIASSELIDNNDPGGNGGQPEGDDLGYHLVGADGGTFDYASTSHGSAASLKLAGPIVGGDAVGDFGYWLVASDGGVFAYGEATFHGGMGGKPLNSPIVGMARTPSGLGYWLVAADGGVFAFGDATFHGSMGAKPLNEPIVSIAAAVDGEGYTLFAADGGTFNFGSARSYGSAASLKLAAPIVGGAMSYTGEGYWMIAADGGVFAYGDASYLGTPKLAKGNKAVGMVGTGSTGYAVAAADGAVYAYGTQPYFGGANTLKLARPIVGMFQGGFL